MLDTIAITLNHMEFEVATPDAFSPSARGLLQPPYYPLGARGNFSCVQNPTKTDFDNGIYKPRLTLTKRHKNGGFIIPLRIEFSAPKLMFGNNFDELLETDFEKVLDILHRKLAGMGIRVCKDVLRTSPVSAIHYSKNIALTDYSTCSMITGELAKTNLNKRLDLSKTDFRNEGHSIRYHANSFEVTFYDKLKDLQQAVISEKRAIERDNAIQTDLFSKTRYPKQLEVLRMEVRLGNRTKIKAMLTSLGIQADTTFHALFNAAISQKTLRYFWQKSTQDMPLLVLSQFKPEDVVQAMIAGSNGQAKPAKLLQHLGGLILVRSIGLRGAKALLERQCNPRTWQRIKKEMEELDITTTMKYAAIRHVENALAHFEPLKLNKFQTGSSASKTL
jgi:hypothetical protein